MRSNWLFVFLFSFLLSAFSFPADAVEIADRIDDLNNCTVNSSNKTSHPCLRRHEQIRQPILRTQGSRGKRPRSPSPSSSSRQRPRHGSNPSSSHEIPYSFFAERLNEAADPCEDFYEFACGGYIARRRFQSPTGNFATKFDLRDQAKQEHKEFIMSNTRHISHAVRMMTEYRTRCMRVSSNNPNLITSLLLTMRSIGHSFPMFDPTFMTSSFDFNHMILMMTAASGSPFMYQFDVQKTPTRLVIRGPDLIAPSLDFYAGGLRVEIELSQHVYRVIELITYNRSIPIIPATLRHMIIEVVAFDKSLAAALIDHNNEEMTEKRMSEVKRELTAVSWNIYWNHNPLIPPVVKRYFASRDRRVLLHSEGGVRAVDTLYNWAKTNNPIMLVNYFFIRFILLHVPYLDQRFVYEYNQFRHRVYGTPIPVNRTDYCFDQISEYFGTAADLIFISHQFKSNRGDAGRLVKTADRHLNDVVNNLHIAMGRILDSQPWITHQTIGHAFRKLSRTHTILGMAEAADYEMRLNREYERLNLKFDDSYAKMNVKVKTYHQHKVLMQLIGPEHALVTQWPTTELNVRNEMKKNRLFLSTALTLPPFLDRTQPLALRYGLVGFMAGHELTHGFDKRGALLNDIGEHEPWWDLDSLVAFEKRSNFLVHVYDKQVEPVSGMLVNGTRTLAENIADGGGIRLAFEAYKHYRKKVPEEHVTGYSKYDNFQTFFISYASYFCSSYSKERAEHLVATDFQAPDRFRVNTVLANYPEFARVFNCSTDMPMHPRLYFSVWSSPLNRS